MSLIHPDHAAPPARPRLYDRLQKWLNPEGPWLWLIYLPIYGITWLWVPPTSRDLIIAAVALPIFLVLYIGGHRAAQQDNLGAVPWIACLMVLALTLSTATTGNWSVIAVYAYALGGSLRPHRPALITCGLITVLIAAFGLSLGLPVGAWATAIFFGLIISVANFFGAELTAKNAALIASQGEVSLLAAQAERERIARDLHDLLGHTLTVVAVKADLAARLVERDPVRAKAEMQDLQATARTALADIRSAVTGMRRIALGAELARARNALAAVDTTLAVTGPGGALPPAIEETLAMLLREGATNIVRHAHASRCDIVIDVEPDSVRFTLSDDGVGGDIREGNGLSGMRARVAAVRGTLQVSGENGTRIEAVLPLEAPA